MKIKNKKNKANFVNFKDNGFPVKILIGAGATVEINSLNNVLQIINYGDFKRGFFEILEQNNSKNAEIKKNKEEDSLKKIEKEVKEYTTKSIKKEVTNKK